MNYFPELELMLFENSSEGARAVLPHGITSFMLDWEFINKTERQEGFDTEIKPTDAESLTAVAEIPGALTWCRINRYGPYTVDEIECAIRSGAHGILLPMVTSPNEVEHFLRNINSRCRGGILIETQDGLDCARELAIFPLDRVYFGLNDFAISRGGGSIFRALLDGSVESAREIFAGTIFGFGGVTAIDSGFPLPCSYLIEEMARLDCQFSFLRRSYRRDVAGAGAAILVNGVQKYWRYCLARSADQVQGDRRVLEQVLHDICSNA